MDIRDQVKAKLSVQPLSDLEAARKFLHIYGAESGSFEEVKAKVKSDIALYPKNILEGLKGIERIIANPPSQAGTLAYLVAIEANWPLDDPTDEGAMIWLKEMVQIIRDVTTTS